MVLIGLAPLEEQPPTAGAGRPTKPGRGCFTRAAKWSRHDSRAGTAPNHAASNPSWASHHCRVAPRQGPPAPGTDRGRRSHGGRRPCRRPAHSDRAWHGAKVALNGRCPRSRPPTGRRPPLPALPRAAELAHRHRRVRAYAADGLRRPRGGGRGQVRGGDRSTHRPYGGSDPQRPRGGGRSPGERPTQDRTGRSRSAAREVITDLAGVLGLAPSAPASSGTTG